MYEEISTWYCTVLYCTIKYNMQAICIIKLRIFLIKVYMMRYILSVTP